MLYAVNEKVLCFHGPLIYQAKVLKAERWNGDDNKQGHVGPHYFVHYQGWKQTWDEWVPETRMLKFNEENIARQKALQDAQKAEQQRLRELANPDANGVDGVAGGAGGAGGADKARRKDVGRGTKRAREAVEPDEDYHKRPEIRIAIPDSLKLQLVDDWENVTKNQLLVPLPREPNVYTILEEYRKHISSKSDSATSKHRSPAVVQEVLSGLKLYFDKSLGNNLLYKYERQQFVEARKKFGSKEDLDAVAQAKTEKVEPADAGRKGKKRAVEVDSASTGGLEPGSVYGAEHLLRLFVNLPGIIAHTTMDVDSVAILKEHIADFLQFMAQNKKRLFVKEYEAASPAYHRITQI